MPPVSVSPVWLRTQLQRQGRQVSCARWPAKVGRYGITVNCIALGTMRTPMTGEDLETTNPEHVKKMLSGYAIRRRGQPADVAGLVAYLASPMASWLTGQTIPLNGGLSMAL